jgi:hypothetical protein
MTEDNRHEEPASGVSLPQPRCPGFPLRVAIEPTREILASLSAAGMNARADDEAPSPRMIVEVDADDLAESRRKVRAVLGDVGVEAL